MASNHDGNLIDFSTEGATTLPKDASDAKISKNNITSSQVEPISSSVQSLPKVEKPNKSLFAITREESPHGLSHGGDDSEFDDTLSETHDSSSTSILENCVSGQSDSDNLSDCTISGCNNPDQDFDKTLLSQNNTPTPTTNPNSLPSITTSVPSLSTSIAASSQNTPTTSNSEPPSRFRIVKIAKAKPYDKGKWVINDYVDSQKQKEQELNDNTAQSKVTTKGSESSGEQKQEIRTTTVTSPNVEPVKTRSNDSIVQTVLSVSQSRGSSYSNAVSENVSSISLEGSASSKVENVSPVVEALDTAMIQIQQVRDSMIHVVQDELRVLRESLLQLQCENQRVREENESLKQKLTHAEERIRALEKG